MSIGGDATVSVIGCDGEGDAQPVHGGPVDLNAPSLTTVGGDFINETAQTDVDISATHVSGDLDITGIGTESVAAQTADGDTTVALAGDTAAGMHVRLPAGTFDGPVGFTIGTLDEAGLPAGPGSTGDGTPIDLLPVSGYAFGFDVPALGSDAALTFTLDLTKMPATLAATVREALDADLLTVYTRSAAGDVTSYPTCDIGVTPVAGGCVTVERTDADHVRVDGVVGHFSDWGLAVVHELSTPVVTSDPTDTTVGAGEVASFTSAATGDPDPTVQWQYDDGTGWTDLSGETDPTLSFTTTAADDGTRYRASWTNSVATVNSAAATLTVQTNGEPTAAAGGPYTVDEGGALTLDASESEDPDDDVLTYAWDLDGDGSYDDATGATPNVDKAQLPVLADGPATSEVAVLVSDPDGATDSATATVNVSNAAPTATVTPPTGTVVVGQPYTVTLAATDPSPFDTAAGFAFDIAWGDGSTSSNTASTATHTYATAGPRQISVTATDDDGSVGAAATASLTVTAMSEPGAALAPDVCAPGLTSLIVTGTAGEDTIKVEPVKTGIAVTLNGSTLGPFSPSGQIVVKAGDGKDAVAINPKLDIAAIVLGGAGNDKIDGDHGGSVYVGGAGNDDIKAGKGRDVLIGASGADTLDGGQGDDVLVAGATANDEDVAALCAVAQQWSRTDLGYTERSDAMTTTLGALLGAVNDESRDQLTGERGQDWFLAHTTGVAPVDKTDRTAAELLTQLF
jgi:Ca2+-binding RTX toxin-like protein